MDAANKLQAALAPTMPNTAHEMARAFASAADKAGSMRLVGHGTAVSVGVTLAVRASGIVFKCGGHVALSRRKKLLARKIGPLWCGKCAGKLLYLRQCNTNKWYN